jgi:hypothetical protein
MSKSPALKYVKWLMKRYRPVCGHPACNHTAIAASIVQDNSGHVMFCCSDMGHWVGTELDVRWVEREESTDE